MCLEIRKHSVDGGRDIYEMLQECLQESKADIFETNTIGIQDAAKEQYCPFMINIQRVRRALGTGLSQMISRRRKYDTVSCF